MILNLLIFGVLWKLRKKNFFDGFIFLLYVVLYSSIRIFVENFRADKLTYLGDISAAQTLGIAAIAVSIAIILFLSRREKIIKAH